MSRVFFSLTVVSLLVPALFAQTPDPTSTDTFRVQLPEVTIEAARSAVTQASAPFAVTVQNRSPAEVALTPGTSLDDVLRPLAGVWVNNRHHFALGERISVRGVGYRSNFGVRGIQVFYDGIPLTLPDGQAFLDVVDPAVVRQVELIRSPASVFWGNGSGGVLFLSSQPSSSAPTVRARLQGGSFGQWQGLLEGSGSIGEWDLHGYASENRQKGFRDHSEGYRLRAGVNVTRNFDSDTKLRITFARDYQDTENPSSLNLEDFREDPTQADSVFQATNARKQSNQVQVGTFLNHGFGKLTLSGSGYYLYRSLENPLPFGYVTYDRNSGGGRFTLRRTEGRLQGGIGLDAGAQFDDRVEYTVTQDGARGTSTTLNQLETVLSGSAFGFLRYNATQRFAVTGGLRLDGLRFEADDRRLQDGDDSGTRTFSAWSPSLGVSYDLGPALLFAQYSTAYETPTASELSNRPTPGQGGFNQQLDPQDTQGFEVGTRGVLPAAQLQFDLALYQLNVDNLVNSRRLQSGYQYYTNLGENTQRGLEASLTWRPTPPLEVAARYTGTQFTIDAPSNLDGNQVPGIPSHRGYVHLQSELSSGWWGRLSAEGVPDFYVNDANTAEAPGYVLLDLRVGHRGLSWQGATFQPFVTIDNVLDERYAGSVVVNSSQDSTGEFYEPGPERSFSLGLNVAW